MKIEDYQQMLVKMKIDHDRSSEDLRFINEKDIWIDEVVIGDEILETIVEVLDDEYMDEIDVIFDMLDIDLPDMAEDMIPYVGELILGLKLLSEIGKEQKQLKLANREMKVKVALAKAMAVISKYGAKKTVANICEFVAKTIAAPLGPLAPWAGMMASIGGVKATGQFFDELEPHFVSWIKQILKINEDDLFYYKHKSNIDNFARGYHNNIGLLTEELLVKYPNEQGSSCEAIIEGE